MTSEVNRSIGSRPRLEWVPVDQINVDRNYQRDIKPHRVRQILTEFSWDKFGALQLAEQADGRFNVFDGQHRHEAARLHPDVTEVPAVITKAEGIEGEAAAFLGVNLNRTAVTPVERYWAGLEAGDADMIAVRDVLAACDCEIVAAIGLNQPGKTAAVQAVSRAIKRYGHKAVRLAIGTIREAWPDDKDGLKGTVITSLSRIIKNNEQLDRNRMVEVLGATDRQALSADAEAIRKISGGDATTSITRTIVELYNRGQRSSGRQISIGVKA